MTAQMIVAIALGILIMRELSAIESLTDRVTVALLALE